MSFKSFKVLHVNYAVDKGGAALACLRIHQSLLDIGIDSKVLAVVGSGKRYDEVQVIANTLVSRMTAKVKKVFSMLLVRLSSRSPNSNLQTLNFTSIIPIEVINDSDADIVHLHWVSFNTLSVRDIAKIRKPIVWTFHDAWPFLGCEHHDDLFNSNRYVSEYARASKVGKGVDWNRLSYWLKRKYWSKLNLDVIVPSEWMKRSVRLGSLFQNSKVTVVPNLLNDHFEVYGAEASRKALGLPLNKQLILLGAYDMNSYAKGGDIVKEVLQHFSGSKHVKVVLFGNARIDLSGYDDIVINKGYVNDDAVLSQLYSAADLFLMPSRQESFSLTTLESMACGTPVVAFDVGAVKDIVSHKQTGYIANNFEVKDVVEGVNYCLDSLPKTEKVQQKCRLTYELNFAEEKTIHKLIGVYESVYSSRLNEE